MEKPGLAPGFFDCLWFSIFFPNESISFLIRVDTVYISLMSYGVEMILLYSSVILFNFYAFKKVKKFSGNLMMHIWLFTCVFQILFDVFIDLKYQGYWYVTKGIDWSATPAYTVLIPPVNLLFLNWFPFHQSLGRKILYIMGWEICLLLYETMATLPEPWGFFRYGWWTLWHSAFINPLLLMILVGYYKLASNLENKVKNDFPGPQITP